MKKIRLLHYCLLGLLVFSSYSTYSNLLELRLDIYETGHIHNDGSGQFEIAADLTKAEQLIKVASLLANITPEATQKSVEGVFSTATKSLQGISGINKVTTAHDANMLYFKLGFHFNSIKALNEAVRKLYAYIDHPGATYFKMDRHEFVRVDTTNFTQLLAHYREKTDAQIEDLILKNILNVITYNIAYSFDRKIKKATHTLASIAKDRKTISLQQPLFDASEREPSLSNKITF